MKRLLQTLPTKASSPLLLKVSLPFLVLALLVSAAPTGSAQRRAAKTRAFEGSWNWAVYAESKDELPPAYRDMEIREVPAYALDITIRQRGNKLSATCGVLARYLARIEDCGFDAVVRNNTATVKLGSSFGGSATVRLTLSGDSLRWKVLKSKGENYYPRDVTLRKMGKDEKPPYAADEEEENEQ
jgi:hypothetical protein